MAAYRQNLGDRLLPSRDFPVCSGNGFADEIIARRLAYQKCTSETGGPARRAPFEGNAGNRLTNSGIVRQGRRGARLRPSFGVSPDLLSRCAKTPADRILGDTRKVSLPKRSPISTPTIWSAVSLTDRKVCLPLLPPMRIMPHAFGREPAASCLLPSSC